MASLRKSYDKPGQCVKKQRHHFADKGPVNQSYGLSGSQVWLWGLDHKESWVLKKWYFQIVVLEKTHESPVYSKKIKSVNSKKKSTLNILWKNWCWSWSSNTLATWCIEPTHWKRHWCWERWRAGREGDDRGWDGWMASPTQWTRV